VTTRRKIFAGLALAAVAAVAGCLDALAPGAAHRAGSIGIVPVFEGVAAQDGTIPADVDSISITIHNPPAADTTIGVRILPGQDSIMISIDVPLANGALDTMSMGFKAIRTTPAPPTVLYQADSVPLIVRAGTPTRADTVRATYVGPGRNILSIAISPKSAALRPGDNLSFGFAALDSTAKAMAQDSVPVLWRSLAPTIVIISAQGVAHGVATGQTYVFVTSGARASVTDSALVIVSTTPVAVIALAPNSETFTATAGGANPAAQTVAVTNSGVGTLTGLAAGTVTYGASEPTGWLTATLDPATAPATLTLQPATGSLAAGTYHATVPVTSASASNSPQTVAVTFTVAAGPAIGLASTSLTFSATATGADPASQTVAVTNGGGGTLTGLAVGTITYGSGTGWLTATLDQTSAPATLTVHAATGSLAAGSYTASFPVTSPVASNSPRTVSVTFTVAAGPAIGLSTAAVTFTDTLTTSDPAAQTVSVTNTAGGALTGLAVGTISYGSGSGWLTASLNQAAAPATLTLTTAKGALGPGTYTATVSITSAVASNSPQTVTVTFTIAAGPAIGLSTAAVTFTDTLTTSDPAAQTVSVTNTSGGALTGLAVGTVTYGSGSGWLTATLNQATAPATLTLTVAKLALTAGTYTATVPITSAVASNSPQTVTVMFNVLPVPLVRMVLTPGFGVVPPAGTLPLAVQGFNAASGPAPTFGLRYLSRTPLVATVDSVAGLVTAVAGGSAVIVASAPGASGTVYDSTLVAVPTSGVAVALPVSNAHAFGVANVGDTVHVVVTVNLGAVPGELVGSYNAQMDWNPSVLQYVSTTPISLVGGTTLNESATSSGDLRFGSADPSGATGPGLVNVKFVAKASGASPVTFVLTDLSGISPAFTQMLTNALVLSGSVQVK
jgi:hypothetical protein